MGAAGEGRTAREGEGTHAEDKEFLRKLSENGDAKKTAPTKKKDNFGQKKHSEGELQGANHC